MKTITFSAPSRLSDIRNADFFNEDIEGYDICRVDFSGVSFVRPMALLLCAEAIKRLRRRHPEIKFLARYKSGSQFTGYASHIGFFKYAGFRLGRSPGDAPGNRSYMPIKSYRIADYDEQISRFPIGKIVDDISTDLVKILLQSETSTQFDLIQYTLREMVRNAFEHCQGDHVTFFGQHWPAEGLSEIAILDDGVGIFETLKGNDLIEDPHDSLSALKFALLPGVTGVSREDRIKQDERWGNSGFGLYMTSRLCAEFGSFCIVSDGAYLNLKGARRYEREFPYPGTAIQIRIKQDADLDLRSHIDELRTRGEEKAKEIISTHPINASMASTMLASDFEE